MISKSRKQPTSNILMIRPCRFFSNPETANSNKFQGKSVIDGEELQRAALDEFDQLVEKLRQADLNIIQFDDTPEPPTPDSVFPNNWQKSITKPIPHCITKVPTKMSKLNDVSDLPAKLVGKDNAKVPR